MLPGVLLCRMDRAALNSFEIKTLRMIERAARLGLVCPSNLDIEMELDCNSTSVAPIIVKRLEEKGFIAVERFQRARIVTVLSTGEATTPPANHASTRRHVPRGTHLGQ